jgi:hypothetical protein
LSTSEAIGVIAFVPRHYRLLCDGKLAYVALVGAGRTDGIAIGKEEEVGIRRNTVVAFDTSEAVDMPERFPTQDDATERDPLKNKLISSMT